VCDKEFGDIFGQNNQKILNYFTVYMWDVNMRYKSLPSDNISFRINGIVLISVRFRVLCEGLIIKSSRLILKQYGRVFLERWCSAIYRTSSCIRWPCRIWKNPRQICLLALYPKKFNAKTRPGSTCDKYTAGMGRWPSLHECCLLGRHKWRKGTGLCSLE